MRYSDISGCGRFCLSQVGGVAIHEIIRDAMKERGKVNKVSGFQRSWKIESEGEE